MKRKTVLLSLVAVAFAVTACKTHYEVASIQRTRIVVDSRYDRHPDQQAADFLKPYKITAFVHAGGHALPEEIKEFVDAVNPAHIIPVHTEHPDAMRELLLEREIVLLEDGNVLKI